METTSASATASPAGVGTWLSWQYWLSSPQSRLRIVVVTWSFLLLAGFFLDLYVRCLMQPRGESVELMQPTMSLARTTLLFGHLLIAGVGIFNLPPRTTHLAGKIWAYALCLWGGLGLLLVLSPPSLDEILALGAYPCFYGAFFLSGIAMTASYAASWFVFRSRKDTTGMEWSLTGGLVCLIGWTVFAMGAGADMFCLLVGLTSVLLGILRSIKLLGRLEQAVHSQQSADPLQAKLDL